LCLEPWRATCDSFRNKIFVQFCRANVSIRAAIRTDFEAVLALNLESERFLSPLSLARLISIDAQADVHRVVEMDGEVVAFVLALREGQAYDSVNYRWFAERYSRFLYIDRVVVANSHQGQGMGRRLYEAVFARAHEASVPLIAAEFDVEPPNPVSERFHQTLGFVEVGRQLTTGGKKQVSLQAVTVALEFGSAP
jgi:uncharacterized protein